jgi:hypothetical protein
VRGVKKRIEGGLNAEGSVADETEALAAAMAEAPGDAPSRRRRVDEVREIGARLLRNLAKAPFHPTAWGRRAIPARRGNPTHTKASQVQTRAEPPWWNRVRICPGGSRRIPGYPKVDINRAKGIFMRRALPRKQPPVARRRVLEDMDAFM